MPPRRPLWIWNIFFLLYLFAVVSNTAVFFHNESPTKIYYEILLGFDVFFLIPYLLNFLAVLFDILALIPFYNFLDPIKHKLLEKSISAATWKWFFTIRLTLLLFGHAYDMKQLQALAQEGWGIPLAVLSVLFIFQAPSHIAIFIYSYRRQKFLST